MTYPNGTTSVDSKNTETKKSAASGASRSAVKTENSMDNVRTEDPSAKVSDRGLTGSSSVGSLAEMVLNSALSFLPAKNTEEVRTMLNHTMHDVQSGLKSARESTASFIRRHPVYSLLGAAAIGAGAALLVKTRTFPSSFESDTEEPTRYDS